MGETEIGKKYFGLMENDDFFWMRHGFEVL
jgi:hypothetical protein